MKRNQTILLILAAAMLFAVSACTKTGGGGSGEKIQLELKLEPGYVHKVLYSSEQTVSQKIMGMSQKVGTNTEMYIRQEVESVDADGVATIKVTYDRVKMSMDNPMLGKQTYDSDNKEAGNEMMGAGYENIIGKSFRMKMDKQAKVLDVMGVEELFGEMFSDMDDEMGKSLKSMFGPEAMKRTMQQVATVFPEVLVGEGDTWGDYQEVAGEFGLGLETTYKVDMIDADKCVLALESEVETKEGAGMDLGNGMSMSYDISGEQTGTIELDRKTGLVSKGEMEQDLKGEVKSMGMTIPMTIISKITIGTY